MQPDGKKQQEHVRDRQDKKKALSHNGGVIMAQHCFTNWTLQYDGKSYPSTCPNDVLTDLYHNGAIDDPYFSTNAEKAREYLKKPATYSSTFFLEEKPSNLRLHFEGIDTFASVYCNDILVGTTDSMFLSYDFDAQKAAKKGKNTLEVRLSPIYDHFDNGYHGEALFSTNRLQVRKAQCHFGWDWAPDLPGYGIYLPASYFINEKSRLLDLYLDPHYDGTVDVEAEIDGDNGSISLVVEGKERGPFSLRKGINRFSFHVDDPHLWFPNGYGAQPLYHYEASVTFLDGSCSKTEGHFAFREIIIEEKKLSDGCISFGFKVNGCLIFAKGSNWVPISNQTGSILDSSYEYLIEAASKAHFNMLRVWGGGIYEKEIFYDLCDKLGILVYQDFMYSCQGVPSYDGFLEEAKKEATHQLRRLRKHPCLAFLSGGNELFKKKEEENNPLSEMLKELCSELVPEIRFVPSTPFGYEEDLWASSSGDVHQSVFEMALHHNAIPSFEDYLDHNKASFFTECTCLGSCSYRSLTKFIPAKALWPLGKEYDYHFSRNPYALDPSDTFLEKEKQIAASFYGEILDAKDFAKKSMMGEALILSKEITHARADENCHGHLNWMYNDNWGNGTWSLIDYYLSPKAAYYASKRSFAPLCIAFVKSHGERKLFIINDSFTDINVKYRLYYGDMCDEKSKEMHGEFLSLSMNRKQIPFSNDHESDYCFASIEIDGKLVSSDTIFFKPMSSFSWKNGIKVVSGKEEPGGVRLCLSTDSYAHAIHFSYPSALEYDDDYFEMAPGISKEVSIKGLSLDEVPKLKILAFADVWDD